MKRKWQLFAAFLAVFATFALFAACSGGDSGGEGNTESETKTFEGIVLESKEFSYDGEVHFLQLTGTVPQGAKVEWEGNGESLPGVYNVSVTVSMEGYETLSLKATLTITGGGEIPCEMLSVENRVDTDSAPAFIWHTMQDECVPVENSLLLADRYRKCGVPFSLHIFEKGWHGLALADDETNDFSPEVSYLYHVGKWFDLACDWLSMHGCVVKSA